jgi:hypothetical protein
MSFGNVFILKCLPYVVGLKLGMQGVLCLKFCPVITDTSGARKLKRGGKAMVASEERKDRYTLLERLEDYLKKL